MKTAIVHDWLNGMRGGEKVLNALIELYPDATIYTLFHERGKVSSSITSRKIVTSWLDRVPGVYRYYRNLLPLFPSAVESFDLRGFDLVISSSHAVAKAAKAPDGVHVCYCHTPMRYVWDPETRYAMRPHQRIAFRAVRERLQQWDKNASDRVDHFIANSQFVRGRIRQYYGRDSDVIFPPVDTRFYSLSSEPARQDFYLAAGAMVSYKRFDVILEAFKRLGKRLLVVGRGPELARLKRWESSKIHFLGQVTDDGLRSLYQTSRAFVFAAREDFGIMPVEAQACGCPVIAFAKGGSLETVRVRRFVWELSSSAVKDFKSRSVVSSKNEPPAEPRRERHPSVAGSEATLKRALDIALSASALIALSPALAAIAASIRLSDGGPAVYRQVRVGLNGEPFTILKFRTMRVDAEQDIGPIWSLKNDPRCTRFGARLRRWGLDELPQLWNILRGDMTLVGPRPERPEFVEEFSSTLPDYHGRHAVRSGLTGYAQVCGWRGATSIEERLRHDIYYIQHWSLGLDLSILLRTLLHGFSERTRDGAR
jgi:exopolysaccharide biosynthesis polyprenyl glycosylphosphotransferase